MGTLTHGRHLRPSDRLDRRAASAWLTTFALIVGLVPMFALPGLGAPVTFVDELGANDQPGQKDLTKLTIDSAGLPATLAVTWNWDIVGISGNNTADGCSLFDSDGNGFADFALCETWGGEPAGGGRDQPLHMQRHSCRPLCG